MIDMLLNVEPVPMARPRFARRGKFVSTYLPPKQKSYMAIVKQLVREQYHDEPLAGEPLQVDIEFYCKTPKSFTKKQRDLVLKNELYTIKKPDLDNYIKILIDACTGIIWHDDNIIAEMHAIKKYSYEPHIKLGISKI